ncbi:MAG: 50S ribosomal protein L23 [Candidatus Omnitrophota bacterium]|nr:50S ribosomal protein L23 [Candidatus Omnitrophota bacterium]
MPGITSIYSVLKSPLITEKATRLTPQHKYIFMVDRNANIIEIKKAVENIYNVKVEKVNSLVMKGKTKRVKWNQPGKTTAWKKAIITLKEGFEIKLA